MDPAFGKLWSVFGCIKYGTFATVITSCAVLFVSDLLRLNKSFIRGSVFFFFFSFFLPPNGHSRNDGVWAAYRAYILISLMQTMAIFWIVNLLKKKDEQKMAWIKQICDHKMFYMSQKKEKKPFCLKPWRTWKLFRFYSYEYGPCALDKANELHSEVGPLANYEKQSLKT